MADQTTAAMPRPRRITDPVEMVVAGALTAAGVPFFHDSEQAGPNGGLDFYLPGFDLHIECKRFHSERIAEQMARFPNVIAIQGMTAAEAFARLVCREEQA